MTRQLALKFRLDDHTHLEDYVGEVGSKLVQLSGFIYLSGSQGSGKSHLLQGICHRAVSKGLGTIYLPALSILEPGVLEGLEQLDLVCLDDVDEVLGLPEWQRALFHLINAVKDAGNTLIVSSTNPVSALEPGLGDLDSRIKGAYLLSTDLLDDEQKLEVVGRKARRRGFEMSQEVCRFILGRSERDMHHLAQLVDQLDEETLRRQKKVTIPFVKAALGL
ncbi:MAG: DnaA regulatory inactivator Hda [Candidatus Azotimanducaceae bacterium WSBS_2022_MAG_OTU7]